MNSYLVVVNDLIAAGADFNIVDRDRDMALSLATAQGYQDVVQVLLEAGARVDQSTLSVVAYSNYAGIREILLNHGVDANTRNFQGKTWLIQAAEAGDLSIVKTLLKAGFDINFRDKEGENALILSAYLGNSEIVKALLESGANVNIKNRNGGTALMAVAAECNVVITSTVLDANVDVNAQD